MSRSRWLRILLVPALLIASGVIVRAWQQDTPTEEARLLAQAGQPGQAAAQPAGPSDASPETVKKQALLAEWALRKRDEATNSAGIYRALRAKGKLNVEEMTLEDVIAKLATEHNLQILIDKPTLTDEGVSLETPITLSVSDVTLRSLLNLVLGPQQLTTIIRHEVLNVTTTTKAADDLDTRMYDVRRLLEKDDYSSLLNVIRDTTEPDTWDDNGGPGSAEPVKIAEALTIRQTQAVHEKIVVLLEELERYLSAPVRAAKPDLLLPDPNREAEKAIRAKLAMPSRVRSDEETLKDLLERLAREFQFPLWLDRPTLIDEGISTEAPISIDMKGVRLQSALEAILAPLQLTWLIEDEVLKITTTTRAADRLVTRVYDVRDLQSTRELQWPPAVRPGAAAPMSGMGGGPGMFEVPGEILQQGFGGGGVAQGAGGGAGAGGGGAAGMGGPIIRGPLSDLVVLIMNTIQPDSWDDNGGPGSMTPYRGLMVIRQTFAIHDEIAALLNDVRMFALRRQVEAPKVAAEDPDELTLFVYRIDDYSIADLEKLIPEVIAPESWKAQGGKGTLVSQPTSLVIRQTPAVHRAIVKLLYKVIHGKDVP